jgi:hypothetical protein
VNVYPRFVVVDDKEQHLLAIMQAFQRLGSPCMGIHYNPEEELDSAHFRGVRCLFLDLHLVDGQAGTDNRRHYGLIATILEDNINQSGGPFILVVWTEHKHLRSELRDYLDDNIDPAKPHARPLAVLSLAKEKFINTGDGVVNEPEELRKAVREAIFSNSQLAALLGWETDVLAAAGDTLASLLNLVPPDQRTSAEFSGALDKLLSRLARETVGRPHVEVDHRAAITNALAPILADRIMNQDVPEETKNLWKKAVTRYADDNLADASSIEAGQVNRMLHLAVPGAETIRPTDWGAVVAWPFEWTDDELASRMGLRIGQMLGGEFQIEKADRGRCKPKLVRIGAACDYAQNRTGPLTYLLGFEIPENVERKKDSNDRPLRLPEAIWRSPVVVTPGSTEAVRLHVHVRFPLNVLAKTSSGWVACYRLREQILMYLIASTSNYASRPGIVQLPIK